MIFGYDKTNGIGGFFKNYFKESDVQTTRALNDVEKSFFTRLNGLRDSNGNIARSRGLIFDDLLGEDQSKTQDLEKFLRNNPTSNWNMSNFNESITTATKGASQFELALSSIGKVGKTVFKTIGNVAVSTAAIWLVGKGIEKLYNWVKRDENTIKSGKEAKESIDSTFKTLQKGQKTIDELGKSFATSKDDIKSSADSIDVIAEKYTKLHDGVNSFTNENISLSAEDYQSYLDICNQLAEQYPALISGYDSQGNAMLNLGSNADKAADSIKRLYDAQMLSANVDIQENLSDNYNGIVTQIGKYQQQISDWEKELTVNKNSVKDLPKGYRIDTNNGNYSEIVYNPDSFGSQAENFKKQLIQSLSDEGIGTYEVLSDDGLIHFETSDIVSEDSMKNIRSALQKFTSDVEDGLGLKNSELTSKINANKLLIQDQWAAMAGSLSSWLQTSKIFTGLNSDVQSAILGSLADLDLSEIGNETYNGDPYMFLYGEIIEPLTRLKPEEQKQISDLLSIDKDDLTIPEYQNQVSDILSQVFGDNPELAKEWKKKLGINEVISQLIEDKGKLISYFGDDAEAITGIQTMSISDMEKAVSIMADGFSGSWADLLKKISQSKKEISSDGPTLASILSDSDNEVSSSIDTLQSDISSLSATLQSLKTGDFKETDLTDLIQQFPQLAGETDNLQEAIANLQADKLKSTLSKIDDAMADASTEEKAKAQELKDSLIKSTDLSDISADKIKEQVIKAYSDSNAMEGMGSKAATTVVNAFSSALMTGTGRDALFKALLNPEVAMSDIQTIAENYRKYLPTAKDVIQDENIQSQLTTYQDEYQALYQAQKDVKNGLMTGSTRKTFLDKFPDLAKYADNTDDLSSAIDNLMDSMDNNVALDFADKIQALKNEGRDADASALQAYVDSIIDGAHDIEGAYKKIAGLKFKTPQFEAANDASSSENGGKTYEDMLSLYNSAKELYDKGMVGTDDFKTVAAMFSPTGSDDYTNFTENMSKIERYFTEGSDGCINFLNDLQSLGLAEQEGDKWTYTLGNSMEELHETADKLGIGFEPLMSMFGRLEDYDFYNDFFTTEEAGTEKISDLYSQLAAEKMHLAQIKANPDTADYDTAVAESEKKIAEFEERIKNANENMDDLLDKKGKYSEETLNYAKSVAQSMIDEINNTDDTQLKEVLQKQLDTFAKNCHLIIDVDGNITTLEEQIDTIEPDIKIDLSATSDDLNSEIDDLSKYLQLLRSDSDVDVNTDKISAAQTILETLIEKKQQLEAPAVMNISDDQLSSVNSDLQNAITAIQNYQTAVNELDKQKSLGLDTSDAQKAVNDAKAELNSIDDETKKTLKFDIQGLDNAGIQNAINKLDLSVFDDGIQQLTYHFNIDNEEDVNAFLDKIAGLPKDTQNITISVNLDNTSRQTLSLINSTVSKLQSSNPSLLVSVSAKNLQSQATEQSSIPINGNNTPYKKSVNEAKSYAETQKPEMEINGNKNPAISAANAAVEEINHLTANIIVGANTSALTSAIQTELDKPHSLNVTANVTTNVKNNSSGIGGGFVSGTMLRVAHASGTAYNVLNYAPAHADGNVTLSHDETALVNEEGYGAESIVRDGKWMIIPGGAHFENLKKGDLIFNKRQTSELINSGRVISGSGHARAYAGGTTTGAGNLWGLNQGKSGSSATDKNTNATNKNTDATNDNTDATKKSSKVWDWIEKRISWWGDQVKKISDKITDYIDKSTKSSLLKQQIGKMNYQIKSNEKGAKAYMKKANKVANKYTYYNSDGTAIETNVPKKYQKLVQKGAYRIEDMDTSTDAGKAQAEAIEQYQTWYEKAKACKQAVVDLKKEQMELFEQWANMPTEEAEQALERLQNGFNGLNATQARLSAAQTGGSTQAAIVAQTKAPYEAAEEARQVASTRLDTAKENAKNANKAVKSTSKTLLKSKGLTDEQRNAIKAGKKIDTSKIKNKTTKKRANAYNKAVTAKDKATNKQKSAQTAYNKAKSKALILQSDLTEASKGYNRSNELSYMDTMTDENVSNMQKSANISNQAWIETKKNLVTQEKAKEKANRDVKKKSDSIIAKYGKKLSDGQKKKLAAGEEIKVDNIKDPKLKSALTTYNKLVSKADDATQKFNITTDAEKTAAANAAEAQTEAAKAVVQATQDKFDNAKTYYEGLLGYQEKQNSLDDAEIDRYNAHGNYERSSDYDTKINNTKASKAIKQNEVTELENRLNAGVANGTIKEGSQEWISMKSEIVDAKKAVADYDTTIENLKQQQIGVYYAEQFDRAIEKINQFKDRLDTLNGIISDDMKIDKNTGLLTEWGAASILLNRNQFAANQSEMQTLLEKENDIKRRYANGEDMSSEFGGKTYDEYMKDIQSQKNSLISSNSSLQNDMLTLIKNQAQAELDALNKVIDKRKKALSAKKEYYDYDKTLKNKTKDIQILERQIAALEGSTNAEDKARKAKLQEQLADAQDSLTDTITDHAYSMQSEALEKLSSDMSDDFEKWSNDISSNVEKMTEAINGAVTNSGMNTVKVVGSLKTILKNFGFTDDQIATVIPDNLTGYASGTDYVPKSGIYRTNENGMESVLSKKYGTLTFLNQGDKVFTADFTQSLLNNAVVATQSSQPQFGEMYKEFMNAINNVNNQSVEPTTIYQITVNEAKDPNIVDKIVQQIQIYDKKRVRDFKSLR